MSSKSGNDGSYSLTVTFDIGTDKNIDAVEVQNRVAIAQQPASRGRDPQRHHGAQVDHRLSEVIALTSPERRYDARFPEQLRAAQSLRRAGARARRRARCAFSARATTACASGSIPERMARLGVTASDIAASCASRTSSRPRATSACLRSRRGSRCSTRYSSRAVSPSAGRIREHRAPRIRQRPGGPPEGRRSRRARLPRDYSIYGARPTICPAALIGIFLQPDANALDTAKQIKQVLDEQAPRFPPGMVYSIPYSTTPFVTESLKEVVTDAVRSPSRSSCSSCILFLQSWRATLIPILVVPISLIGTFAAFAALGLFHQHADAVRAGARHRHRGRRRDRGRRSRAAAPGHGGR